jgi:hypothetical protein
VTIDQKYETMTAVERRTLINRLYALVDGLADKQLALSYIANDMANGDDPRSSIDEVLAGIYRVGKTAEELRKS